MMYVVWRCLLQHPAAVWGAQGGAGGEPDVLPVPLVES